MSVSVCTCGCKESHVVMSRTTRDGYGVELWSDGALLALLGRRIYGVPVARPRTEEAALRARDVGRKVMEWVCAYDLAELGDLYAKTVKECKR